jgi:outer membrane biosynthesis protein TonB
VVPKVPAFPEDEKTTLESGWEEEASTTVEQGEVAEKIRSLAAEPPRGRSITSTGNSVVDEPTVDDQRANAALAMITPPNLAVARLVVTQGNDLGQQLEIGPGKSYTIGRAIDNDFVLTDIAVSRKHFDLRPDGGAWILADRGSGNGTLINGNLEDQPFVLANGDAIEIGNTVFRFEQANAPPRPPRAAPMAGRYDLEADEEEPSTVAGKPVRSEELATPAAMPPPPARLRPKTVPPPAPLPRPRSLPPPPAYPNGSQSSLAGLPGLPPHMARPVMPSQPPKPPSQPQQVPPPRSQPMPQMLQASQPLSQPMPQMLQASQPLSQPMSQVMQAQHAGMRPPPPPSQPLPATTRPLPQLAGRSGPMAPQGPTMLADAMAARPAALPTTIPGQGPPAVPSHPHLPYSYPSVADMQQHAQMLVVGNGVPRDGTSTALVQPTPFGMPPPAMTPSFAQPTFSRRTKLLLGGAALTLLAAVATIAIMKGAESKGTDESSGSGSGSADEGSGSAQKSITPIDPPKPEPTDPAKPDPAKPDPAKNPDPPTPEPPKPEPPKPEPPRPEPPTPEPTIKPDTPEPPKPDPTTDPSKSDDPGKNKNNKNNKNNNLKNGNKTQPTRPQVGTAPKPDKPDTSSVRNRAIDLYRQKKFGEAAALLNQYASTTSGTEASDLRTLASVYQQLGVAYNRGMAPAAKPVDAFKDLRRALNLDTGAAAGEFKVEIKNRLAQIAPKAAMSFYVRKEYDQAAQAVRLAEANGVSNGDTKLVRDKLEQAAKDLYDQAAKEINSNPDSAKQKLRQIKGIVDANSPTLAKATAMLNAN